jgi:hypothetical protein
VIKKWRFTEEQIIYALRLTDSGKAWLQGIIVGLASDHRRFGYLRMHGLLRCEGIEVNHKRTLRERIIA